MTGGYNMINRSPYLGILGGMGPQATADFFLKIIAATPATKDQEHLPIIIRSVPQIPDRSTAIMGSGASPLPALIQGVKELCSAGATAIAIPCNTAHYWHSELAEISTVPIFHIADTVANYFTISDSAETVGILATEGTIEAGIYQKRLTGPQIENVITPSEVEIQKLISPGIAAVKAGDLANAEELLTEAAKSLRERGATSIIMACTEIPIVLEQQTDDFSLIDATNCLAEYCVSWWNENNTSISKT